MYVYIRFSQSVQHMKVLLQPDGRYRFGQSLFSTVEAFKKHFEIEKPVIGGETGTKQVHIAYFHAHHELCKCS